MPAIEYSAEYVKAEQAKRVLHQFYRACLQIGRMPSVLGGEIFRSRPENHRPSALEDLVAKVVDVERFLEGLEPFERRVVGMVVLRGYSEHFAARRLRRSQSEVSRAYWRGILALYGTLERCGYLQALPEGTPAILEAEEKHEAEGNLAQAEAAEHGPSVAGVASRVAGDER